MKKDNDLMKKLAPQNIDEFDEILRKYPITREKAEGSFSSDGGMNVVDEPVEVITKSQWYRSPAVAAAAAFVLAAGVVGGTAVGLRSGKINSPLESSTDMTEPVAENVQPDILEMIPLAEVTDEWMANVFFGSNFPYIIYADDSVCIFTEGADSIFIYDFGAQELTFSANLKETFDLAGIDGLGAESWNGINMLAYSKPDGVGLMCTAYCGETGEEMEYIIDTDDYRLVPELTLKEYDLITPERDCIPSDLDENALSTNAVITSEYCVYLANNHSCDDVLPGEGSHLPMIDIILRRYTDSSLISSSPMERFSPFSRGDFVTIREDDYRISLEEFSIQMPPKFSPLSSEGPNYFSKVLDNGDVVNFYFTAYPMYSPDTGNYDLTPEDAVMLFGANLMGNVADRYDGERSADGYEEEVTAAGCSFIHQYGTMTCTSSFEDDVKLNYTAYFGIVPCTMRDMNVKMSPVCWVIFTSSDNPETLEFINKLDEDTLASVRIEQTLEYVPD